MPGIAEMKHMVSQGKYPSTGHLEGVVKYLTHRFIYKRINVATLASHIGFGHCNLVFSG